jgi:hypothetical protein
LTRWLTTARAAIAPLMLNSSIQSLSTMPARLGVVFAEPDARPAAAQREHQQVVGVGGVDAPLLVRRDEVEHDFSGCRSALMRWMPAVVFRSTGGR